MGFMEKMMETMMGRMSKEEKEAMMGKMMDKFFGDLTADDKQKMMAEMMPKMMDGIDMREMMPQMMMTMMGSRAGGGAGDGRGRMMQGREGAADPAPTGPGGMMPQMMATMMPQCIKMMLPGLPKDQRAVFAVNLVSALMEQGKAGLTDQETEEFRAKVSAAVRAA